MQNINVNTLNSSLVSVSLSMWSGRAKLDREDLNPEAAAKLPPDQLALLGQKKLVNPDLLKPITAIKSRMYTFMNLNGVRMLGGWMCDDGNLPYIAKELDDMANDFGNAVNEFLSTYMVEANNWAKQFPEWEQMILSALPTIPQLQKKFAFNFRAYKLAPQATGASADDSQEQLNNLANTAFAQIADDLKAIYDQSFANAKEKYTTKSFSGLKKLVLMTRNLSFTDPTIGIFAEFLRKTIDKYEPLCKDSSSMNEFRLIIKSLTDVQSIADLSQVGVDTDPSSIITGIATQSSQQSAAKEAAPEPQEKTAAENSEQPLSNPESTVETKPNQPEQAASPAVTKELFDLLGF